MRAIAAETGVGWRTVTKWVRSNCLPDSTPMTPRPSSPGYFKDYLLQRWAAGCTHGQYLFWDIRNRSGRDGTLSAVSATRPSRTGADVKIEDGGGHVKRAAGIGDVDDATGATLDRR
jgi:hypothetical protein